jgi:hypothetical protein
MTSKQAEIELQDSELIPLLEGGLAYIKELYERCLDSGVPALLGGTEDCGKSCAAKARLLVREDDAPRVAEILRGEWMGMVQAEGTVEALSVGPARELGDDEEPPCPACGTAAPLVDGACSDCGLMLG